MKVRRLVFVLTLLVIVICGIHQESAACSCATPPACEAFNRATAVFIGRAIHASKKRAELYEGKVYTSYFGEVVFEIIEPFYGVTGRLMTVWASGGGMCWDMEFGAGETYLVYANEVEDKKLWVGGCGRTRSLRPISIDPSDNPSYQEYQRNLQKEYDDELEFLRNVARKTLSGARIYGEAHSILRLLGKNDKGRKTSFLAGATIKIESQRQSLEVKTDSDGKFDIRGLEPGVYKVTSVSLEGYFSANSEYINKELSLRDCGCAQLRLIFSPSTQVNGRVLDAEGKPLAGVEVSLISEKWREEEEIKDGDIKSFQTRDGKTDTDGRYKIGSVEHGRYLLGVSVIRPTPKSPYTRIFYPGVADIKQAEVITIEPGKTTGPFDLRLTHKLEKHTIQGIVVWPDDTPVVGAKISLLPADDWLRRWLPRDYEATTDERGRFNIDGLKDYEYKIQVYLSDDELDRSVEEELKVPGDVKDLKIVVSKRQ